MTVWSTRERKGKIDFFKILFSLEEFDSRHCLEYSNDIKLKRQQMRKKKTTTTKTEIQINEEPKLRIKSEITVIIIALDKGQKAAINFLTHLKV